MVVARRGARGTQPPQSRRAFERYRTGLAKGRFLGMQAASQELSRGVSVHYAREGEPLPEGVSKIRDEIKMAVSKATNWDAKYEAYRIRLWNFGNEMGVDREVRAECAERISRS
jgi:hypothetical protein